LNSFVLDYENEASIKSALEQVIAETSGTLDALFNNGAYAIPGPVEDLTRAALRANFEANFFGYFDLINQVIPLMRAQGHGRIVNCSSVLGFIAAPWRGSYNATKFALEGLTDTLRVEMRDTTIHICLIEPGPIATDFRKNCIVQFEKWIDWKNSARAAQFEASLLQKLYTGSDGNRFELPASAVTKALIHALEANRPKPRYFVTIPTHLMGVFKRILPTRAMDWILSRA
jgi:NAD(P)-dependent dehydrogenase (short-subunit alcohol dehydrogenase family)